MARKRKPWWARPVSLVDFTLLAILAAVALTAIEASPAVGRWLTDRSILKPIALGPAENCLMLIAPIRHECLAQTSLPGVVYRLP